MTAKLIAWAVFLSLSYGAWNAMQAFSNPWGKNGVALAPLASPVLADLPASPVDCKTKGCL